MTTSLTPMERLDAGIDAKSVGCWLWTKAKDPTGYGRISVGRKMLYAHRLAYELQVGPIPVGFDIDHLCRNRACINPAHLEAVTRQTNLLRGNTLTRAHVNGDDCGHDKCVSCRHRPERKASA